MRDREEDRVKKELEKEGKRDRFMQYRQKDTIAYRAVSLIRFKQIFRGEEIYGAELILVELINQL